MRSSYDRTGHSLNHSSTEWRFSGHPSLAHANICSLVVMHAANTFIPGTVGTIRWSECGIEPRLMSGKAEAQVGIISENG